MWYFVPASFKMAGIFGGKSMYKMINQYGNEIKYADNEAKKKELIDLGFKVIPQNKSATIPQKANKKAVKKNETEN